MISDISRCCWIIMTRELELQLSTNCQVIWYLSEEFVAFAFFDQEIPDDLKRHLVLSLRKDGFEQPLKCALWDDCAIKCKAYSVSMNTWSYFQKLHQNFLDEDPST